MHSAPVLRLLSEIENGYGIAALVSKQLYALIDACGQFVTKRHHHALGVARALGQFVLGNDKSAISLNPIEVPLVD